MFDIKNILFLIFTLSCITSVNNALKSEKRNSRIKLLNVQNNQKFYHRVILLKGLIDYSIDVSVASKVIPLDVLDGSYVNKGLEYRQISIENLSTKSNWPVSNFHEFKGLVKLADGLNSIKITYSYTHKIRYNNKDYSIHETSQTNINLIYEENTNSDPLHLSVLIASDSKERFDIDPSKNERNDLNSAIKRFQTVALLWQAFTCDDLFQKGLGCRTFRFEETSNKLPVVNLIRSKYNVKDLRTRDDQLLFNFFLNSIRDNDLYKTKKHPNKQLNVAGLVLDSHWDVSTNTMYGSAALGGAYGDVGLGIFGSYLTYSWPENLDDVQRHFTDDTFVDYKHVYLDSFLSDKRYFTAFSVGAGALLHEVGHAYGLENSVYGMMARGFDKWNRAFLSIELNHDNTWSAVRHNPVYDSYIAHTWELIDAVKLSLNPDFRLPHEVNNDNKNEPNAVMLPISTHEIMLYAKSGISIIEFRGTQRFLNKHYENPKNEIVIDLNNFPLVLNRKQNNVKVRLEVITLNNRKTTFDDLFNLLESSAIKDNSHSSSTGVKFKTQKWGFDNKPQAPVEFDIDFDDSINGKLNKIVTIYNDYYLYGLRFIYANGKQIDVGAPSNDYLGYIDLLSGKNKIVAARVKSSSWIYSIAFGVLNSIDNTTQWTRQFGGNGSTINKIDFTMFSNLEICGVYGLAADLIYELGFYYRKITN